MFVRPRPCFSAQYHPSVLFLPVWQYMTNYLLIPSFLIITIDFFCNVFTFYVFAMFTCPVDLCKVATISKQNNYILLSK